MGDPISTVASIATILELGGKVISYSRDVWIAEREQNEVRGELIGLLTLLYRLQSRVQEARDNEPWSRNVMLLGRKNGEIDQLAEIMKEMAEKIDGTTKSDRLKQALKWKFTKEEIKKLLERIERLKSLVQSALTDDHFNLSLDTQGRVVDTQERVATISEQTARIDINTEKQVNYEEHRRMTQWLEVPDPSENFHAALKKRHYKTGLWLVEGSDFENLKKSEPCLMWLHGNAGCGKTVLSATALEAILELEKLHSDVAVAYFFFDFNDAKKQSTQNAARSILLQLAQKVPEGFYGLTKLYDACGFGQMKPSIDQIFSLLREIIMKKVSTYIIMDALDECKDREDLLEFICNLISSKPKGLRIFATSRRERDIEEQLSPITDFQVNIQSALVDNDIRVYVQGQLSEDIKLKNWDQLVHDDITKVIMEKAGGMFRWVYCQLQVLRKCNRKTEVDKALKSLPKTLDETYERILRNFESEETLQDAIVALQWLCYSERPLGVSEVAEVLALRDDEEEGFMLDRFPDPEMMKDYCSSLVAYGGDSDKGISDKSFVRIAHFSVQEYLFSGRCAFHSEFEAQTCHRKIAKSCLRYLLYLSEQAHLTERMVHYEPLASYAAMYWWRHVQNVDETYSEELFNLASKLLNDKATFLLWVQLYDIDYNDSGVNFFTLDKLAHPLYYAASIGIPKIVEFTLLQTPNVNATGGRFGNALKAASAKGHEKIVQLLLDAGADVNTQGGEFNSALQAASFHGYVKTVQLLLDSGADVNIQGGYYGNALNTASYNGSKELVRMLLDAGADINAQGGEYGTALNTASYNGSKELVRILLDAGADINAQGGYFGNALQAASYNGSKELVRILLDAGADINAQGGRYGTALQAASSEDDKELVRMLLDAGADINSQGGRYGTALQTASYLNSEDVVQVLLDAGADINAQGGRYGTALQAASYRGNEELVRILLDIGAEVNAQGGKYGSALQAASYRGNEELVRILLDAGANVNAQGGEYGSALQAASYQDSEDVVQVLLDAGADINAQGGRYGTALQAASSTYTGEKKAASYQDSEDVVQVLLDAGADINSQGGQYGSALQAASAGYAHAYEQDRQDATERIIRLLVDAGADLNIQREPALQVLLKTGISQAEPLIQMLLDAGAEQAVDDKLVISPTPTPEIHPCSDDDKGEDEHRM